MNEKCLHDLGWIATWEPNQNYVDGALDQPIPYDKPMRLVWRCKSCRMVKS